MDPFPGVGNVQKLITSQHQPAKWT